MILYNGRHLGADTGRLIIGQGAEVAARNSNAGDDIGFALGRCAHAIAIQCCFLPAGDNADIEGEVLFRQFSAEAADNTGQFKDCAIACTGAENARAVARLASGGDDPAVGGSAGDGTHIAARIAHQPFKIERNIRLFARRNQVCASQRNGLPAIFLIARHMDVDIGPFQRAGRLHGAQSRDDGHQSALVIASARPFGFIQARTRAAHKCLKGGVGFKHRVEMRDQKDAFARLAACAGRDQMPGALGGGHILPHDAKAQRL